MPFTVSVVQHTLLASSPHLEIRYQTSDANDEDVMRKSFLLGVVLLSTLVVAQTANADVEVPENWSLKPTGLTAGDRFRLLMVTTTTTDADNSNISSYDRIVQNDLRSGHTAIRDHRTSFKALVSTEAVDARDNTATTGTGVPIYWLGGSKVADDYADFYDGDWDNPKPGKDANGNDVVFNFNTKIWTGCKPDGTELILLGHSKALGADAVWVGLPGWSDPQPLSGPGDSSAYDNDQLFPIYGLSPVFLVSRPTIELSVEPSEVSENAGATTVTVTGTLNAARPSEATAVAVTVGAEGDSATEGTDYATVADLTLTIAAGQTTGTTTFTLTPTDDAVAEGAETVSVTGTATGFTVTGAMVTLTDDDTASTEVTLSVAPATVAENAGATTVTVTGTLNAAGRPEATAVAVTVGAEGDSATEGTDYATVADLTLTIAAGQTTGTTTFTLTPTDDAVAEGAETVSVTGTATGFTVTGATVTLTDDDTASTEVTLSVAPATVAENAGATTVTVTGTLNAAGRPEATAVAVTVGAEGDSATEGTDYATVADLTLTIAAGQTTGTTTFTLTPTDDAVAEGAETVSVTGTATGFTVTGATVTLTDDDTASTEVTLSVAPASVAENAGATTVTVTGTLNAAGRPEATAVAVTVGAEGDSATEGTDYATVADLTLTIAAGQTTGTTTFTLTPTDDAVAEGAETVSVAGTATGFTVTGATVTLTDDENQQSSLTIMDASALESSGTIQFVVKLGAATTSSVTVDWQTFPGTATADEDYATGNGRLTFVPGGLLEQSVNVSIIDDNIDERDETFTVVLSNVQNALVEDGRATGSIMDDDAQPRLRISNTEGLEDNGALVFAVHLDRPSARAVRVNCATAPGTATAGADYTVTRVPLVFAPGETAQTIVVPIVNDAMDEEDEAFTMTLSAIEHATFAGGGEVLAATGTIVDDDEAPQLTITDEWMVESNDTMTFKVTLETASGRNVTVAYTTTDQTATTDKDYRKTGGIITFMPGETIQIINVQVMDDMLDEDDETFMVELSDTRNATLADDTAMGTIADNDRSVAKAWLARFARTVTSHMLDAVGGRLTQTVQPGLHVAIGGQPVNFDQARSSDADIRNLDTRAAMTDGFAQWTDNGFREARDDPRIPPRNLSLNELLLGSSFSWAADSGVARWTAWARGAATRFTGADGDLSLDGTVTTVTLGADYERGRLLTGLAVAHSVGTGGFDMQGSGRLSESTDDAVSSLTSVHPYLRYQVNERLEVWGMLSYGQGELELTQEQIRMSTDIQLGLGIAGVRGSLLSAEETGGVDLAIRSDAFLTRIRSDATPELPGVEADVSRIRVLLEGSHTKKLTSGGVVTPAVQIGLRYDAGDAETGTGVELGTGLGYTDPALGLIVEVQGRGLLAHEDSAYKEWGVGGSVRLEPDPSGLGPSFIVSTSFGDTASGAEALWTRDTMAGLGTNRGPSTRGTA